MKINDLDRLRDALPENPGIQGEDYVRSAVLLLLVPVDGEFHILLEKRSSEIRQGGEVSFPGGRIDKSDVSPEAAVLRETEEEVGIPSDKIQIIGQLDSVFAPMGALVNVFIGVAEIETSEINGNPDEVARTFLVPVSFFEENPPETYEVLTEVHPRYEDESTGEEVVLFPAEELGLPERYWNTWGGFRHNIYVYRTAGETIWGLTARIVVDFVRKLSA